MKHLKDYLTKIANARADALAMIESEGYVFRAGNEPITDAERWEKLAFTLHTRLGVVSATAEEALAALLADVPDDMVDDAEWQRRHS